MPHTTPSAPKPRAGSKAGDEGSYIPIMRLANASIDPGESLSGELYITGYGEIGPAKLVFYPSKGLFEPDQSRLAHSLQLQADGSLGWGATANPIHEDGITLGLRGVAPPGSTESTLFFDVNPIKGSDAPQISTEISTGGNAPFGFKLRTKKKARPGQYELRFVMSYHNGHRWAQSEVAVPFTIRNLLQRHEIFIGISAVVLGVIGSIAAVIGTIAAIVAL